MWPVDFGSIGWTIVGALVQGTCGLLAIATAIAWWPVRKTAVAPVRGTTA